MKTKNFDRTYEFPNEERFDLFKSELEEIGFRFDMTENNCFTTKYRILDDSSVSNKEQGEIEVDRGFYFTNRGLCYDTKSFLGFLVDRYRETGDFPLLTA